GGATWYEFAKKIFELSGVSPQLIPITTAESGTKIARPAFSVLENQGLPEFGISPLRPWQEALRAYLDEIM
ncbi:MAG: sugar nucleotide-binding protein, partial [Patescibacteria group bacterium]